MGGLVVTKGTFHLWKVLKSRPWHPIVLISTFQEQGGSDIVVSDLDLFGV